MFKVAFALAGPGPRLELGPYPEVRMEREVMRAGPGGPEIARHRDHLWHANGKKFFRVDIEALVRVHFEDGEKRSENLGSFAHFSCADGIAYGDGKDLAHIDPHSGLWHCRRDGSGWKDLVVVPE